MVRALIVLLLAGCCPAHVVTRPVVVETERLVMRPLPPELLAEHPIVAGPLAECPAVAAARRQELEACNADKRALQGENIRSD